MTKDAFELAAEAFAAWKDKHPDEFEMSAEEFEAIRERQGWTYEEALRWVRDEGPLPAVRHPLYE